MADPAGWFVPVVLHQLLSFCLYLFNLDSNISNLILLRIDYNVPVIIINTNRLGAAGFLILAR